MDNKLLLVKCITLLYRESQLELKTDSSIDLVRTTVESIQTNDMNLGLSTNKDVISSLKDTVVEMCKNGAEHEYDIVSLLQRLKLNSGIDDKLYESLEQGLETELGDSSLKRTIVNLRKSISNHSKEEKVQEILNKAAYQYKFKRDTIKDLGQFIMEHIAQLEPLQLNNTKTKDPAIVSEIDIGDIESVTKVFKEIKTSSSNEGMLVTGWQGINRMFQGGLRRGESVRIDALQHKYKTGFTLTLFKDIALNNVPYMIDSNKKPLLLRISFEDEVSTNIKFLYESLRVDEGYTIDTIPKLEDEDMAKYVTQKLQVNGYHIKLIRVIPDKWTYLHLCNYVIGLEVQGYEVHMCMVDYLSKLPTTGCSIGGPMGSDHHDLHNRMRNFFSPRRTTFITPHQLSQAAKILLRDGRQDLVKEIVGLGYTEKCGTIDQIADLEIIIHLEKFQKETYLTIQRGKHRGTNIIPEELKYCVYKFPKTGPIPSDINGQDMSLRRVGGTVSNTDTDDGFGSSSF